MLYWATSVTAIGWFLLANQISKYAKTNKDGIFLLATRYRSRIGMGAEISWKMEEMKPLPKITIILMAVFFSGPLMVILVPWLWLRIIPLIIFTFMFLLLWSLLFHNGQVSILKSSFCHKKEISRERVDDEKFNIAYGHDGPTIADDAKNCVFSLLPVSYGLIFIYFLTRFASLNGWAMLGVIYLGLVLMVVAVFLIEKRRYEYKRRYPYFFCRYCGARLKIKDRPSLSREHIAQNIYAERTNYELVRACSRCGFESDGA